MGIVTFLVGFMLCGFIIYTGLLVLFWKALRGEKIGGMSIDFKRGYSYRPVYQSYTPPTYTRYKAYTGLNTSTYTNGTFNVDRISADIVEAFEEFLERKDVSIPNEDRDQEEDSSSAYIYGTDYADLLDTVREILDEYAEGERR